VTPSYPISPDAQPRVVHTFDVPTVRQSVYRARLRYARWGLLPVFAVGSGLTMLTLAIVDTASRYGAEWPPALFWVTLSMFFAAAAGRLLSERITPAERIGLVVLVGLTFYAVKVLAYPSQLAYFDEFLHWQTVNDILQTKRLFSPNTLLPISPLYPGLELIASAITQLTGLNVSESGIILIGVARVLLMLALYLLFKEISRSPRIAALGALLYTCHTNFLFFSSEFSYESLALPLATFGLFVIARRLRRRDFDVVRFALLILLLVYAVAVTHHLTGFALAGIVILWTVVSLFRIRGSRAWLDLALIGAFTLLIIGSWTTYVGNTTSAYLGPVIQTGVVELLRRIAGENIGRELFQSSTGVVSPSWERIVGISGVAFILLMLPVGLFFVWRRYRRQALALTLGCLVLIYPAMQAFRLTSRGWELASRSAAFLFLGIAFVLAVGFVHLFSGRSRLNTRLGRTIAIGYMTVIFVGGAISGWPSWGRLPGPYIVAGDPRAIEAQGIAAAEWVGANLPPKSRIGADRINMLLMAALGNQRPVTHLSDNVDIADVYFAPELGSEELLLLYKMNVRLLVVDERITTGLPVLGAYFESTENGGRPHKTPPTLSLLEKFDGVQGIDRIYDGGVIKIYDVSQIAKAP